MRIFLLPLLSLTAIPAFAASDTTTLDEVVVTATRSMLDLDRLPASAVVIRRDAIERFAGAGLPELLRFHAGFDIAANGGPGTTASLFLRGSESNHVLLLIDGVEMNPGSIGGPALQHIPLESIERIEVIKGPRSALYGSEAIGGVINVITRRGSGKRWSLAATAGSFGTQELDAGAFGDAGKWHYGLELGRHESDGFPPRADNGLDRGYERDQLNARMGWRGAQAFVEVRHWRAEGVSEYLGFALEPLSQAFENTASSVDLRYAADALWSTRLLIGQGHDATTQQQENFLGEYDVVETDRDTLDWQHDFRLDETLLLTGGAYLEDTQVVARSFGEGFNESQDVNAIYLQGVTTLARDSIVLAARSSDYETVGRELTWNAGWNRAFTPAQRLFVSAGTAFRAPDATDRFGFGGNPALEPETSQSVELGYEHDFRAGQSVSATLFRNDIEQLIAYVDPDGFGGPLPGGNVNIDEARIEGIELGYAWRGDARSLQVTAIVQDPRDLRTDSQLARRARRSLTASHVESFGDVELGIDLLVTDRRPDSPFSSIELPGYGVVSASLRWFVSPHWSLATRIENVGDREYQTAAGYNSAERSIFVTLRYGD